MNLKPMDKNTLKFLKLQVKEFEEQQSWLTTYKSSSEHFAGYHKRTESTLLVAVLFFTDLTEAHLNDIPEFMEAIKNADTPSS